MEKRKKAANWLNREINCLLDLMLQKQVMKLFDDKKTRSCDIYKMLSREMKSSGYDRDEEQIKFKFVKLKTAYMKQLNNNKTSGHKREEDEFYDKMSQLLQTRPASAFRDSGFDSSSVQGTSDVESTSLDEVNEDAPDPNESSIFRFTDSSTPTKTLKAQPPTKRARTSYRAVVTSVTADLKKTIAKETKKSILALEKLQENDQKFQLEMQQKDQNFLTDLF